MNNEIHRVVIMGSGPDGFDAEQKLRGHGVSACATCDGYFFRDREVVVAGGGDTAMEEALFLSRLCSTVTIIHRRNQFRASQIMNDRVVSHPKIKVRWNSVVEEIIDGPETTGVTGIQIKNLLTDKRGVIPCSGVFICNSNGLFSFRLGGLLP